MSKPKGVFNASTMVPRRKITSRTRELKTVYEKHNYKYLHVFRKKGF